MKLKQDFNRMTIKYMWCFLLIFTLFTTIFLAIFVFEPIIYNHRTVISSKNSMVTLNNHSEIINIFFSQKQLLELSNLGELLFKNNLKFEKRKKIYRILIWKDGEFLKRRHILSFSNKTRNPFDECSVDNCILTYDDNDLDRSDAVVFLLHRTRSLKSLPDPKRQRPPEQRWIFLTDESPYHTFMYKNNNWTEYSGIFNWSMSYKMESDVPVPYGRTVYLKNTLELELENPDDIMQVVPNGYKKRRDVLVAILISNCGGKNNRMSYIKELSKYLTVDVYGGCGNKYKKACPGHFKSDCPLLNDYIFYLAFENSNCNEYLTEKIFWNGYAKGAVPIIMGPSQQNCKLVLPPNSYIHVKDYAQPRDLATYLLWLNRTWNSDFYRFHQWRRDFSVENEHAYFNTKSTHYCRICEALNFNSEETKVYDDEDLSKFLSPQKNCY